VHQWDPQQCSLLEAVGQVFGEHRASIRETLTNLKERIIRLETTSNFEERFTKLAHQVKRGSEMCMRRCARLDSRKADCLTGLKSLAQGAFWSTVTCVIVAQ
jgi:hypothetical protein